MVSIEHAKRYHIDNDLEMSSKKARFSSSIDLHTTVSLNSSFHSENLSRLKVLFPFKSPEELSSILEKSCDSFDYAVLMIQKLEEEKSKKASNFNKAHEMVVALSAAQNINQAVQIAMNYLEVPCENSGNTQKVTEENNVLRGHIEKITNENRILKMSFRKLLENSREVQAKDQQIEKLNKELENERIKSYHLSMQLIQVHNKNKINPSRELF